jgi:hypothetical protein
MSFFDNYLGGYLGIGSKSSDPGQAASDWVGYKRQDQPNPTYTGTSAGLERLIDAETDACTAWAKDRVAFGDKLASGPIKEACNAEVRKYYAGVLATYDTKQRQADQQLQQQAAEQKTQLLMYVLGGLLVLFIIKTFF